MKSERDTHRAEAREAVREVEQLRARKEAATQRATELEQERDELRVEIRQLRHNPETRNGPPEHSSGSGNDQS